MAHHFSEQDKLDMLLQATGAGTWDWNIRKDEAEIDDAYAGLLGYSADELRPFSFEGRWKTLAHADDISRTEAELEACFRRETPYPEVVVRMRHRDGTWLWMRISGKVIEWLPDGRPLRMFGTLVDVSDRNHREFRIRQQTAAIEAANDGIGILVNDAYVFLNAAHVSLFGYDHAELLGKSWRRLYPPDTVAWFESEIFPILQRDGKWQGETVGYRKDGTSFEQGLSLTLAPGDLLICITRDISPQKEAERALEWRTMFAEKVSRISTRLSAATGHNLDAEIESALEEIGTFTNVDRAYLFLFGEGRTLVNTHEWCADGVSPEKDNLQHVPADSLPWWTAQMESGNAIRLNTLADLPSGAEAEEAILGPQGIQSLLSVPVQMDGAFNGFLGFDSVRRPRQWSEHEEQLLTLVSNAIGSAVTRNRHSIELEAAEAVARTANRAKTDFLASMSHDLRTPLNAIMGFQEILLFDETDPNKRELLKMLGRGSETLLEMISGLLEYARIEAGQVIPPNEPFATRDVVDRITGMLQSQLDSKRITVGIEVSREAAGPLQGPVEVLRQILLNFFSNTLRIMGSGTIEIFADLESHGEGSMLSVHFEDDGPGISAPVREQIESLIAGERDFIDRISEHSGTGIGLSICLRLAHAVGGSLSLSTPRKLHGAAFTVVVPVASGEAVPIERESLPTGTLDSTAADSSKHILVVEDDQTNTLLFQRMLEPLPFNLTFATDFASADKALMTNAFDLVLTDIKLPDQPGTRLIENIRQAKYPLNAPDIPVFATTAYAIHAEIDRFVALGANRVLTKPISLKGLHEAVLSVLAESDSQ